MLSWNDPLEPLVGQLARTRAFVPPVDVTVSEGDMVLTMDVPGLTQDDLQIEMLDGHLYVRGARRAPDLPEGSGFAHRERAFGQFERRIRVPDGVDPGAIMANLEHGVLSLIMPKPERLRPRTIAIGGGADQRQHRLETATN